MSDTEDFFDTVEEQYPYLMEGPIAFAGVPTEDNRIVNNFHYSALPLPVTGLGFEGKDGKPSYRNIIGYITDLIERTDEEGDRYIYAYGRVEIPPGIYGGGIEAVDAELEGEHTTEPYITFSDAKVVAFCVYAPDSNVSPVWKKIRVEVR